MDILSLKVLLGMPLPLFSLKMFAVADGYGGNPVGGTIFSMLALVFSCVTMSIVAGNSTLPPTWSACVWVLISRITGLLVSSLILSRIGWPQPGFFASTTVTPSAMMNTAVLPPPPLSTNRLSLSLVTSKTFGAVACCCAATTRDTALATTSTLRTIIRFMRSLQERRLFAQTRMLLPESPRANQQMHID